MNNHVQTTIKHVQITNDCYDQVVEFISFTRYDAYYAQNGIGWDILYPEISWIVLPIIDQANLILVIGLEKSILISR